MTAKIENRKSDFNDVGMWNDVRNIVPYIITIKYYSVTTSLRPEHLHDHLKLWKLYIAKHNLPTIFTAVTAVEASSVDFRYSLFTCSVIEKTFNGGRTTAAWRHLLLVHQVLYIEAWILNSLYLKQQRQHLLLQFINIVLFNTNSKSMACF